MNDQRRSPVWSVALSVVMIFVGAMLLLPGIGVGIGLGLCVVLVGTSSVPSETVIMCLGAIAVGLILIFWGLERR